MNPKINIDGKEYFIDVAKAEQLGVLTKAKTPILFCEIPNGSVFIYVNEAGDYGLFIKRITFGVRIAGEGSMECKLGNVHRQCHFEKTTQVGILVNDKWVFERP